MQKRNTCYGCSFFYRSGTFFQNPNLSSLYLRVDNVLRKVLYFEPLMMKIFYNSRAMKLRLRILTFIFSILILVFISIGYFGARLIIKIDKENSYYQPYQSQQWFEQQNLQSKNIIYTSNDGLKLKAILVNTDSLEAKGTIILMHGIRSGKERYLEVSKKLAENGYNAVLVDLRAHGESEGEYCTFGYYEKQDVSVLIDTLLRKGVNENIGIWGHSLGAAISLQAMSLDKRIKYGVIESTFSDFRTIVHDYSERTIGTNIPWLNDYSIRWAEYLGDFSADKIIPSESVKNITQPVLMVHGNADHHISIQYGEENFKNLASSLKEFYKIEGAGHNGIWIKGGEAYFKKVFSFLEYNSVNYSISAL